MAAIPTNRTRTVRLLTAASAVYAFVVGATVLVGWLLDVPALRGAVAHGINVKTNTAIGMLACGVALLALRRAPLPPARRYLGYAMAAPVALIGLLTLSQHVLAVDLGIDQLIATEAVGEPGTAAPNRMGPPASTCFVLLGLALLLIDRTRGRIVPAQLLGAAVCALCLPSLVGYIYGASELFGVARLTGISALTATVLFALGAGITAARPERGPMTVLTRDDAGGVLARRALPVVVILPVLAGWLVTLGQSRGQYDAAFGTALLAAALSLCLAALVWWTAAALGRSEQRTAAIVESCLDGIITMDHRGRIIEWNPAAEHTFGYTRQQVLGRSVADTIIPERMRAAHRDGLRSYLATGTGPILGRRVEMPAVRADGTEFPLELAVTAMRSSGRTPLFTASVRDISERHEAEQHRELMLQELDHRVKNNLAAVLAIVEQTAASCQSPGAFITSVSGRLAAMARLHEMLAMSHWEGAELRGLVEETLAPYRANGDASITIDGEAIQLPGRVASPLAMALHELATNAAKYGALSVPVGRVRVGWRIENANGEGRVLRFGWSESGGPPVQTPSRQGFGTELIEEGLPYETKGTAKLSFDPAGLVCEIELPLAR